MTLVKDHVAVANRLRPVLLQLNRFLRREAHALGVTGSQATLLRVIQKHPELRAGELAAREGVSAPAMSRYLDRLEKAGLIKRERSRVDARRVHLALTPQGERVLDSVRRRRTAWLAARLERLSPGELERLEEATDLLERLVEDPE
jgi:DNA-binding MarR family transcriptional regulator